MDRRTDLVHELNVLQLEPLRLARLEKRSPILDRYRCEHGDDATRLDILIKLQQHVQQVTSPAAEKPILDPAWRRLPFWWRAGVDERGRRAGGVRVIVLRDDDQLVLLAQNVVVVWVEVQSCTATTLAGL